MLIEDIVEYEGTLWTDGRISYISINRLSYKFKRVQVFNSAFLPCIGAGVNLGEEFRAPG